MEIRPKKRQVVSNLFAGLLLIVFILSATNLFAKKEEPKKDEDPINSGILNGLTFRSIGPAYASGRIADFAT